MNLGNSYSKLRTIKWWAERRAQETQNWAQMLHHVKNLGGREREMGTTQRYLKKNQVTKWSYDITNFYEINTCYIEHLYLWR